MLFFAVVDDGIYFRFQFFLFAEHEFHRVGNRIGKFGMFKFFDFFGAVSYAYSGGNVHGRGIGRNIMRHHRSRAYSGMISYSNRAQNNGV